MMAELGHFNANDYDPFGGIEALPPGWYSVQIVNSEIRETSDGDGHYLWLQLEVVAGEHEGAPVFDLLNIHNQSETAERIAHQQLSSICRAVDIMEIEDSEELHFKPFMVRLAIRKTDDYGDQNDIKGYRPISPEDEGDNAPESDEPEPEPAKPEPAKPSAEAREKPEKKPEAKSKVNIGDKTGGGNKGGGRAQPSWRR